MTSEDPASRTYSHLNRKVVWSFGQTGCSCKGVQCLTFALSLRREKRSVKSVWLNDFFPLLQSWCLIKKRSWVEWYYCEKNKTIIYFGVHMNHAVILQMTLYVQWVSMLVSEQLQTSLKKTHTCVSASGSYLWGYAVNMTLVLNQWMTSLLKCWGWGWAFLWWLLLQYYYTVILCFNVTFYHWNDVTFWILEHNKVKMFRFTPS